VRRCDGVAMGGDVCDDEIISFLLAWTWTLALASERGDVRSGDEARFRRRRRRRRRSSQHIARTAEGMRMRRTCKYPSTSYLSSLTASPPPSFSSFFSPFSRSIDSDPHYQLSVILFLCRSLSSRYKPQKRDRVAVTYISRLVCVIFKTQTHKTHSHMCPRSRSRSFVETRYIGAKSAV
jgi:hypothetical protein